MRQFSPRCARDPVDNASHSWSLGLAPRHLPKGRVVDCSSHFCYGGCRQTCLFRAGGIVIVRAPASTANLGPGFDCAAAALDLWNELHVEEGDHAVVVEGEGAAELRTDDGHLALRAFSLVAPVEQYRFRFVNRIPLERGLGSSAATIAAGLVAGAAVNGREIPTDELLRLGLPLEGHADNLAAALHGGVCLIWQNGAGPHTARIAGDLPLSPVLVLPDQRRPCRTTRQPRQPRRLPCSGPPSPRATRSSSPTPSTTGCTSPTARPTRRSCRSSATTPSRARRASRCPAPARPSWCGSKSRGQTPQRLQRNCNAATRTHASCPSESPTKERIEHATRPVWLEYSCGCSICLSIGAQEARAVSIY
ncbi:MAG: hypothetical protein E6G08_21545, partial [Actinobacteria bacterium]